MTVTAGLQYELYGAPGGFPVLLHHGLLGSASVSPAWAKAALAQGIELISVARPGYGESKPVEMRCVAEWSELVAAVLDELDIGRYGVWGVSAGAPYAYALASLDSDRVARVAITSGLGIEAVLQQQPWGFELAAITAPVRIWHSSCDDVVPYATAKWTTQLIPGAILQNQAAPGHLPSRDTVRAAMVFLSLSH